MELPYTSRRTLIADETLRLLVTHFGSRQGWLLSRSERLGATFLATSTAGHGLLIDSGGPENPCLPANGSNSPKFLSVFGCSGLENRVSDIFECHFGFRPSLFAEVFADRQPEARQTLAAIRLNVVQDERW